MAVTLWSMTLAIWVFVSILCATAAIFAFMQPFWVVNHGDRKSFGLYGFCAFSEKDDTSLVPSSLFDSVVDVIVIDGGGFEVVGGVNTAEGSRPNASIVSNATTLDNETLTTTPLITTGPLASSTQQYSLPFTSCGAMFGSYYHFPEIFTSEIVWKVSGSLYAVAVLFLCLSAIAAVVVMFVSEFDVNVRRLCRVAGLVQLSALGLFMLALATFPAVMTSSTASSFCPSQVISVNFPPPIFASTLPPSTTAKTYNALAYIDFATGKLIDPLRHDDQTTKSPQSSDCHFGWAFVLATMNSVIVIFLPILCHFIVTEQFALGDFKVANV